METSSQILVEHWSLKYLNLLFICMYMEGKFCFAVCITLKNSTLNLGLAKN